MQIARDLAASHGPKPTTGKVMGKKQRNRWPYYRRSYRGCGDRQQIGAARGDSSHLIEPFRATVSHPRGRVRLDFVSDRLPQAITRCKYFAALMSSVRDKTDKLVSTSRSQEWHRGCCRHLKTSRWSTLRCRVADLRFGLEPVRASAKVRRDSPTARENATASSPIFSI